MFMVLMKWKNKNSAWDENILCYTHVLKTKLYFLQELFPQIIRWYLGRRWKFCSWMENLMHILVVILYVLKYHILEVIVLIYFKNNFKTHPVYSCPRGRRLSRKKWHPERPDSPCARKSIRFDLYRNKETTTFHFRRLFASHRLHIRHSHLWLNICQKQLKTSMTVRIVHLSGLEQHLKRNLIFKT